MAGATNSAANNRAIGFMGGLGKNASGDPTLSLAVE
jgi:hypothetical protein